MYPAHFEYHRAESVGEALALLRQHGDEAKLLAGGHSLIPLMKFRLAQPAHLVDIGGLDELHGIRVEQGAVAIGALTTHYEIESSSEVRKAMPVLAESAAGIGDQQVRNRGTLGGSLAHADPAADWPAVALALGAQIEVMGEGGRRRLSADEFFVDLLTTALAPDEVITRIRFPIPPPGTGAAYVKHTHAASRFAVCGVAAQLQPGPGGVCQEVRVAVTGVGPKAVRVPNAEQALTGRKPDAAAIGDATVRAADGLEVNPDLQGSAEYKQNLVRVYVGRALESAAKRMKAS